MSALASSIFLGLLLAACAGDSGSIRTMFQRARSGRNQGKEESRLRLALFFYVEITMPKGPFLPSDFTATKFSTAADKAEFGNTLLRFIESEWASALFTKSLYSRLSMCFGHIAHSDREGFFERWFTSEPKRLEFLRNTLDWPCWGSPEFTFCDVERASQEVLRQRNYLARYELRAAEEFRSHEIDLLLRLEAKYRTPLPLSQETAQEPSAPAAIDSSVPSPSKLPVQTSLF